MPLYRAPGIDRIQKEKHRQARKKNDEQTYKLFSIQIDFHRPQQRFQQYAFFYRLMGRREREIEEEKKLVYIVFAEHAYVFSGPLENHKAK